MESFCVKQNNSPAASLLYDMAYLGSASYRSYVRWQPLLKRHPYEHDNIILTRVPPDTPSPSPHPGDSGVAAVRLGV